MLSPENNDLLTLTGPGTPAGDLFRRYWLPVCLTAELPAPDAPPVRVRVLGEKLVAFRDSRGKIGLVGEHCPHRGASLYYGRNEECGLRCLYHGWKVDTEGKVLETPAEPDEDAIREGVRHLAYPTHEAAGMVFAYMGPPEKMPLFPAYRFATLPPSHTYVTKALQECNYLQGLEGECDSSHLSFLHRVLKGPAAKRAIFTSRKPAYDYERTDFGVRLIATRVTPEDELYVRISSFVMPISCWVPARNREAHYYVPIDDTHSWRFDLGILDQPVAEAASIDSRNQYIDADFNKIPNMRNDYLQDREMQKHENFSGMTGFLAQDSCVTESMGPRFDRSREYLGKSDAGVVAVRNVLLKAIKDLRKGIEPPHLVTREDDNRFPHIDACQATLPLGSDWREAFPHLAGAGKAAAVPAYQDRDKLVKRER